MMRFKALQQQIADKTDPVGRNNERTANAGRV